jgi:hypothetical protein
LYIPGECRRINSSEDNCNVATYHSFGHRLRRKSAIMRRQRPLLVEVGTYSATFVIVPVALADAELLLPRHMQLGSQDVTDPGTHPLLCTFGEQSGVRTIRPPDDCADTVAVMEYLEWLRTRPVRPCLQPLIMRYLEVITVLPFVEWVNPNNTCPGPFLFAPRLYLDHPFATFGGWLLGYAKEMARMQSNEDRFRVYRLWKNVLLFTGRARPHGKPAPPSAYPNFRRLRSIFRQPVVGRLKTGLYLRTLFEFQMHKAQMRAAPAEVKLTSNFFNKELTAQSYAVQGIDQVPQGAFSIEVPWRLREPFLCHPR